MTNNSMCTEELWNSPPGPPIWTQYDKELVFKDQSITGDEINHFIEGLTLVQYPEQLHMTNYPHAGFTLVKTMDHKNEHLLEFLGICLHLAKMVVIWNISLILLELIF